MLASPPETHSPEQLLYLLSPRSANPGNIQKLFSHNRCKYIETNINTIPGQYRDPLGGRRLSIGHFGTWKFSINCQIMMGLKILRNMIFKKWEFQNSPHWFDPVRRPNLKSICQLGKGFCKRSANADVFTATCHPTSAPPPGNLAPIFPTPIILHPA